MKKLILIPLILIAFAAIYFIFQIRQIDLDQNSCLDQSQIQAKGQSIFLFSKTKLEKDLKNNFPCISEIEIKKVYPSKLQLDIDFVQIAAQIANSNLYVTQEGQIMEGSYPNLPTLFLPPSEKTASQKLEDPISLSAAKIAGLLKKSDFHATNIRILDSGDIAVYDAKETVVIFSKTDGEADQVDSLQQVLARAKMGGDQISKIDLRFEKPVITYK